MSWLSRTAHFTLDTRLWEVTLKPSQAIRFGMVAVSLALLLAACAVHPSAPIPAPRPSTPEGTASQPTSEATASPSIEPTSGLESPESPTGGAVAISMAPAPTGNNGTDGACVRVSWLGNPIPRGDIVTITSAIVETPFTFDAAATANCGTPSCVSYQFSAANDSGQFCYVGIGSTKGSIDPDGSDTEGHMKLVGRLRCPPNVSSAACQRDATAMQRPGIGRFNFNVNVLMSGPSSPPPESPPSSPATTPSSSPSTTLTAS
jgi:hypothetical protein